MRTLQRIMTGQDLHARLLSLPFEALLALYAETQQSQPDATGTLARALRDQARAGKVSTDAIPVLVYLLVDAPNAEALSQLAKALASFGRQAALAEPHLVERLRTFTVISDPTFWAFDGALHALGYLGGDLTHGLLDELAARSPSPVLRARGTYRGTMAESDRQARFEVSLADVRTRLDGPEVRWADKQTQLAAVEEQPAGRMAPWMTRGG